MKKYKYKTYQFNLREDKPLDKKIIEFIECQGGLNFLKSIVNNMMLGTGVNITSVPNIIEKEEEEKHLEVDENLNKNDLYEGF